MNKYYKSAVAATELNKLPSFVNTTTDSVLYKLLNIPSVEIDYISKDIEETKWNIIPSTSNLYLPASVYWLNIDSDTVFTGFEKRTIFDFTFGLPTGYTDLTTPLSDISVSFEEDVLDIAFSNPLYYINDDVSKKIDEGFVFLLDGTTWFDQQLLITDTSFSIIDTISLDTKFQDIDNAEKDEWVTLTLLDNGTGQYTLANLYVKTSSVKVIAPLVQNAEGEYPYELSDNEFSYNSTTNTITIFQDYLLTAKLIVEYEYSPFEKLYSFTYLKDIHSVLTTTSSANIPFILPIFPPGYELVNNEGYELLVPEHIAGPTNYEDANGNLTPYTVLFKKEFVNVGTAVKGTALFKRVHKFDTVNLSYGGLNSSDVPYWSALLPFTPESGAEVTHCFLTNSVWNKPFSKGTVEELTAEEEWEDSLYYTLTDNGLLVFANHPWDIGPLQFYTSYNFQHTINSAAANSPITYVDNNGDTQYYSYLAEIQSYTSWYFTGSWTEQTTNGTWIEYSLDLVRTPETSSLYIGQNAYPESLAWYPRTKYIEEDDFDQALLSVNKQHVETRSLVGTLLNRWAVPDSHTPLSVRRFKEYFVLLSVLAGDYFLTFYSIHDEEEILQIDLDNAIANPIAFTFNKKGEILIAGDGVYKLVPERKVYTELENTDSDTNSFFYFSEDPSALGHTPETLLVEHTLDHWGRVIGNERWYNESLEEYLNRLSNVVQAKGDTNKQKAIDGLSACFNETSYYVDTLNAITTSYPFTLVEETLVSTLDATDETVSLPTLMEGTAGADPSGLISIRDITQNTALVQTAIVLSNVTSDSNPALHYSTLTIPNQSETHSYLVKYKSKVSLDVGTISDINYEDKSSNYGRLIVDVSTFNSNSLTDVTAAYYTSDPGNTYIDNSSPRNFNYKYVEEVEKIQTAIETSTLPASPCVDVENNSYQTVEIGTQRWMAENLRTTKYKDGTTIPTGYSNSEWDDLDETETGAYAVYPADDDAASQATCEGDCSQVYGNLYNWYAVDDERGVCPEGWHIPTEAEWTVLEDFITNNGYAGIEGNALKEIGYEHWNDSGDPAENGIDIYGFTGLPGGYRASSNGYYNNMGSQGYFWSSTEYGNSNAGRLILYSNYSDINRGSSNRRYGFSVRCVEAISLEAIKITDIQKADYATHSAAITDLLSTRDFKFKWDEFIWDKYRWQDGESIKTGVPTTFDASIYANGTCSDSQWTTQRECTADTDCNGGGTTCIWTDSYTAFTTGTTLDALEVISKREEPLVSYNINEDSIVLKTGTFYYNNGEFFLYPTIPSYDLLTELNDENILTRDGPTGASPVAGRLHIENILVNEGDDENDEQNNIDGGCGPANYTYPQGPAYDNQTECEAHGQCVVSNVEVFQPGGYLQTVCENDLSGVWTAYAWTDGTRQMTNVVEGESFKQQYNYLQYREGLLRPMVDMSTDLQSLVDAKPYHSEVVDFLDDYAFTATSNPSSDPDPYFRLTNSIVENTEVIVADFSNATAYHDLYYTNDSTTEYDTGITITSDLLPDKKIFAVGDIDSVYSTITAIPQELAVKAGAIPDPFMIKVTVKDSEGGYIHNAVIQIENTDPISVIYPGVTPYTNIAGEVLIPIDISNITADVTLTIKTTQEGENSPSEDVTINTTLTIQYLTA